MIYLQLFFEFCKAGLFAIGGGLATLPFLQEISVRTGWFTMEQLADMVAVSECTPGPIGINMATYVGFSVCGIPGAAVATLGLIFPSIVIIILVARILKAFRDNRFVDAVFYGLRPASTGLIAAACVGVAMIALLQRNAQGEITGPQWKAVVLALILWILMNPDKLPGLKKNALMKKISKLHPVVFLGASAVIGILFGFAQ